MSRDEQIARAGKIAGRFVRNYMPKAKAVGQAATRHWMPAAEHSKLFVKHVIPATVKPIHSLWHEVLGFIFLAFAGIGGFRIYQRHATMPPSQMLIVGVFVLVMAGYGISSMRKARRISKS